MATFDVLLRGGLVIDGTGAPARRADVGVEGDRIVAVGDLSAVNTIGIELVVDATGRVIAPGFIDPHGHSDGSLFVDEALASHLLQGFRTQHSGNCGDSLAPVTTAARQSSMAPKRASGRAGRCGGADHPTATSRQESATSMPVFVAPSAS